METLFSLVVYLLYGFFGLLLLLFILAIVFGKRIKKLWEYEAEFRDAGGREFGEFDFEKSRIVKDESEYSFKAEFKMRHESLEAGQRVQVFLDDLLVMEGTADRTGRILLGKDAIVNEVEEPRKGQTCRVLYGGLERFTAPVKPD
jgi:hypothetical protein